MTTIRLGSAHIHRVAEQSLPVPLAQLTDDDEFLFRQTAHLPEDFLLKDSMAFRFSNHSWIVRVDGLNVLIDPCTGNGRSGRGSYFDNLDTPFLERLSEAGIPAESIDVVFCTHLHHDHCGWNTMRVGEEWVPTFPNATYLFTDKEFERWDTANPEHPNRYNPNTFDECVRPIIDAGLAKIISAPHVISPSLTIEPAPGHTVGHALVRLHSDDVIAYFSGDAYHHPIQLARPELHLPGCDDLDAAIATRRELVRRALDEEAFLFPAHFPAPHYGRIAVDGDEVSFTPGGAPESTEARAVTTIAGGTS